MATKVSEQKSAAPKEARPGSAIGKAFALLDILVSQPEAVPLHDLADRANMPKPSAHRMLLQLEETGIVKRDLTGKRFTVGDGLTKLAIATVATISRTGTVRDILQNLVDRLGETCNLGVLDGSDILYLERVECDQPLRVHLSAGSRVAIHATALGKLALAYMDGAKRDALLKGLDFEALTPHTLGANALLAQLPGIREQAMSVNRQESMLGLVGLGVPVMAPDGQFLAGLAVHAPVTRFDEAAMDQALPLLKQAAQDITALLMAEGKGASA